MDLATLAALATTTTAFLVPYLEKAAESAAEKAGETIIEKLPVGVKSVWNGITAKFKGKPAAEEAAKDLLAKPADEDNQASFRKELKKALEADPDFVAELQRHVGNAQQSLGDSIVNSGSGAVATHGGVSTGQDGVAIKGDVKGNINLANK